MKSYAEDSAELTVRMREVLRFAAQGASAAETAAELHVSEATVRTVRAAAFARLGARNIVEAVAIVVRRGVI